MRSVGDRERLYIFSSLLPPAGSVKSTSPEKTVKLSSIIAEFGAVKWPPFVWSRRRLGDREGLPVVRQVDPVEVDG